MKDKQRTALVGFEIRVPSSLDHSGGSRYHEEEEEQVKPQAPVSPQRVDTDDEFDIAPEDDVSAVSDGSDYSFDDDDDSAFLAAPIRKPMPKRTLPGRTLSGRIRRPVSKDELGYEDLGYEPANTPEDASATMRLLQQGRPVRNRRSMTARRLTNGSRSGCSINTSVHSRKSMGRLSTCSGSTASSNKVPMQRPHSRSKGQSARERMVNRASRSRPQRVSIEFSGQGAGPSVSVSVEFDPISPKQRVSIGYGDRHRGSLDFSVGTSCLPRRGTAEHNHGLDKSERSCSSRRNGLDKSDTKLSSSRRSNRNNTRARDVSPLRPQRTSAKKKDRDRSRSPMRPAQPRVRRHYSMDVSSAIEAHHSYPPTRASCGPALPTTLERSGSLDFSYGTSQLPRRVTMDVTASHQDQAPRFPPPPPAYKRASTHPRSPPPPTSHKRASTGTTRTSSSSRASLSPIPRSSSMAHGRRQMRMPHRSSLGLGKHSEHRRDSSSSSIAMNTKPLVMEPMIGSNNSTSSPAATAKPLVMEPMIASNSTGSGSPKSGSTKTMGPSSHHRRSATGAVRSLTNRETCVGRCA